MDFDGFEKGEASGTKRENNASLQQKETKELAGGVGEDVKPHKRKISKTTCSRLIRRRVCRRLRRQKINEKMKALQEVIPNCSKRGQTSILEDAINYIKNMQFQLQLMMSIRAVCSTFRPPWPMTPQPGMQIPSLAPFTRTRSGTSFSTSTDEIKYEIETRAANVLPSSYFPTELPDSYFLPLPTATTAHQQSCTRRGGSTVRVLPSQIVLPHDDHVNEDFSHTGSSEWFSSSESE